MPESFTTWATIAVMFVGGLVLLAKGASGLVGGGAAIAKRLGVRPIVIGLTVVAWGTSAPEVFVCGLAANAGRTSIALGNALGSSVANVGLVLAACGLVLPRVLATRLSVRDSFWAAASLGVLWILLADGELSRVDAVLLLVGFAIHNLSIWSTARRLRVEPELPEPRRFSPWLAVVAGGIATVVGAQLVVAGAQRGAAELGVDERIVGLTLVALGTSLPELAAGLAGAVKGHAEISLGNIVGSNVFNSLAVLGVSALVRPFRGDAMPSPEATAELTAAVDGALAVDLPVVAAFTVVLVLLGRVGGRVLGGTRYGRAKAGVLLVGYAAYTVTLF